MPTASSTPLPVSTSEWIPSDSIAELPVIAAATNLSSAMATFAPMANATVRREPSPDMRRHPRRAVPAPPSDGGGLLGLRRHGVARAPLGGEVVLHLLHRLAERLQRVGVQQLLHLGEQVMLLLLD